MLERNERWIRYAASLVTIGSLLVTVVCYAIWLITRSEAIPDLRSPWVVAIAGAYAVTALLWLLFLILKERVYEDDFLIVDSRLEIRIEDAEGKKSTITKTRFFKPRKDLSFLTERDIKCEGPSKRLDQAICSVKDIDGGDRQLLPIEIEEEDSIDKYVDYKLGPLKKGKLYELKISWSADDSWTNSNEYFELSIYYKTKKASITVIPHPQRPIVPGSPKVKVTEINATKRFRTFTGGELTHNEEHLCWSIKNPPKGKVFKLTWDFRPR